MILLFEALNVVNAVLYGSAVDEVVWVLRS